MSVYFNPPMKVIYKKPPQTKDQEAIEREINSHFDKAYHAINELRNTALAAVRFYERKTRDVRLPAEDVKTRGMKNEMGEK